ERFVQIPHLRFNIASVNILHRWPPWKVTKPVYTIPEVVSEQVLSVRILNIEIVSAGKLMGGRVLRNQH
ncbi:hypothetical protein, partial [Allorhodopirellula solitaria]|uniref:hypothetical protein n=1 Tax=Allorhodopirellula solitaria TaxID=2527987 RepID=UPI001C96A02E